MVIESHEELKETIDMVIEYLSELEHIFYVALDVAQQLRDEVAVVVPDDEE